MSFEIELGESTERICDCCDRTTVRVWGYIRRDGSATASYFVEWTRDGVDDHGAFFDFIIGNWGDGTSSADRAVASLEFRRIDEAPQFSVIDAATRRDFSSLAGSVLSRAEVIGTPLASMLFGLVDAVWLQDPRIDELTGAG